MLDGTKSILVFMNLLNIGSNNEPCVPRALTLSAHSVRTCAAQTHAVAYLHVVMTSHRIERRGMLGARGLSRGVASFSRLHPKMHRLVVIKLIRSQAPRKLDDGPRSQSHAVLASVLTLVAPFMSEVLRLLGVCKGKSNFQSIPAIFLAFRPLPVRVPETRSEHNLTLVLEAVLQWFC